MFLTVHAPVGALIGVMTGDPVSAFALGVVSHGVFDAIPHGDEHLGHTMTHPEKVRLLMKCAAIDGIIMTAVLAHLLTPWRALPSVAVLAGIAGGILPDFLQGLSQLFPANRPLDAFHRFHDYIHVRLIPWESPVVVGMLTQLATLVVIGSMLVRRI